MRGGLGPYRARLLLSPQRAVGQKKEAGDRGVDTLWAWWYVRGTPTLSA
jgi:hypothetical protein